MGMNIKDPEVHAMARQLAAQRGTTVTDAVRQALSAELERSQAALTGLQEGLGVADSEMAEAIERQRRALP